MRVYIEIPKDAPAGQHGVYYLRDDEGRVVYIGRTRNLYQRLLSHRATRQPWWPSVRSLEWVPCASYGEAVALERAAIQDDGGENNRLGAVDLLARKPRLTLPPSIAREIRALYTDGESSAFLDSYMRGLVEAGWTRTCIGQALGITRERVRQRIERAEPWQGSPLPRPPRKYKPRKVRPSLLPSQRQRLVELHTLARRLRGNHGPNHPYRAASVALTELIVEHRMRGVLTREIADALGISDRGVIMRLKSAGYLATAPSMTPFGTPHNKGRAGRCKRNHEMSGDNVRLINGDPKRRVCRACERIRVDAYQQRKRKAAA